MKPLGYYVLVEIEEVEETSEGGIILHKGTSEKEQMIDQIGTIREVGPTAFIGYPGCDDQAGTPAEMWGIQIGDKVLFEKYAGEYSKDDSYRLIPDSKIIGLIERSKP